MENPFSHNRATNLIGKVLDEDAKLRETGEVTFASLEYRIMMRLFNAGCLTPRAEETIGLAGRMGYPEIEEAPDPSLSDNA